MNMLMLQELLGIGDSRGLQGILRRGKNVYRNGSYAAHQGGGPQYGRPTKAAIQRRLNQGNRG